MFAATVLVLVSSAVGQSPSSVNATIVAARPAKISAKEKLAAAPRPVADQRDVVLLLDDGPLHLRLHLALGGVSLAEARRQYVARLVGSLDADGDGRLSRDEATRSPLLRTKTRPGAKQFLEGLQARAQMTARDIEQTVQRLGGEIIAYRQDLSSSQNDLEVFKLLDTDNSGVLEGTELEAAGTLVLSKDGDGDECISFEEFFPPPPAPDPMQVALGMVAPRTTPLATVADIIRDTREPLLARRLLKKYDRNRDLQLDLVELGWSTERTSAIDTDGNGRLDAAELTAIGTAKPDIELSADLKAPETEGGLIDIASVAGSRLDRADRPDYAKVGFASSVVTFSHRNLDPVASAVENAMQQFNALDLDANGYLDRDETAERIRFERGLFDMIDMDGDDKVFADEMKQYVRARSEPAATTCRLNVYDTGYGFFMALDANADGRVSVREMRGAADALAQLDRDGQSGVDQKEPVRHFHVEFVRGSYQLFGPSEQLVAQSPAFQQRRPTGPIWFQRMDRNNDGDLTWNEFLGPREVFHRLDGDFDALIDPQEAVKAE